MECSHLDIFEDEKNGYDVCINCGLVLNKILIDNKIKVTNDYFENYIDNCQHEIIINK